MAEKLSGYWRKIRFLPVRLVRSHTCYENEYTRKVDFIIDLRSANLRCFYYIFRHQLSSILTNTLLPCYTSQPTSSSSPERRRERPVDAAATGVQKGFLWTTVPMPIAFCRRVRRSHHMKQPDMKQQAIDSIVMMTGTTTTTQCWAMRARSVSRLSPRE